MAKAGYSNERSRKILEEFGIDAANTGDRKKEERQAQEPESFRDRLKSTVRDAVDWAKNTQVAGQNRSVQVGQTGAYQNDRSRRILAEYGLADYTDDEYKELSDWQQKMASSRDWNEKVYAQLGTSGWADMQGDADYVQQIDSRIQDAQKYLAGLSRESITYKEAKDYLDYLTELQRAYRSRAEYFGQFENEDAYNAFTGLQGEYEKARESGESYDDVYRRLQAQADQDRAGNLSRIDQLETRADELDQMLMNGVKTVETPQGLVNVPLTAEETQQLQQEVLQIRQERDRLKAGGYESNYAAQWARTLRYADLPARQDFLSGAEAGRAAYEANEAHAAEALEPLRGGVADNAYQFAQRSTARYAPSELWSEQERNTFYWLWQNRGREAAVEYGEDVNMAHNTQAQAEQGREHAAWAEEHPGATFAMNIAAAPWQMAEFLGKAEQVGAFGRYVPEAEMGRGTAASTMMTAVAKKLNEKGTLPEWLPAIGGKGLGDAYQLANSIAKSWATARLGGGATNLLFFGEAANSGFDEAKARGASDDQALIMGALNGAAEVIGETVSIERLVKMKNPASFRRWLVETMKQGGVEASEEVFTTLMNTVSDAVVMGDKSQLQTSIREKMADGMSREQAEKEAWQEWFNDIAYDAVGGFISGGVSGGLQQGGQILRASTREYSGADADRLVELALQEQEGSKARALAEKIQKQGTMSQQEAARLRELMPTQSAALDQELRLQTEQEVRERLSQEGIQVRASDVRAITEELLGGEEQSYSDATVQRVAQEMKREHTLVENVRYQAAQRDRQRQQTAGKLSEQLTKAFTASKLEISDRDMELLQDGYVPSAGSVNSYVLGVRDAYRLGRSGMSLEQAQKESGSKIHEVQFRHAWQLGYQAGGGKLDQSGKALEKETADISTEEGKQRVLSALSMLGSHAETAAAVYQETQDVEAFAADMNKAAALYAAAGADVASVSRNVGLLGLTAEQMKAAQEIGSQIRQERQAAVKTAQTRMVELRQKAAAAKKAGQNSREIAELEKAINEASAYGREQQKLYREQLDALEQMAKENPEAAKTESFQKALAEANRTLDTLQTLQKTVKELQQKKREMEGRKVTKRKRGTVSFGGGKIDGREVAAVDPSKLSRAQKRIVAMVSAIADAVNLDYVFFQGEENVGGAYEQGGVIYINLNAGGADRTIAAATLSHEMTHFLQEYAPEEYRQLRDFVVDTILQKSPAELERLMQQQAKWEPGKSWDYLENELVANACQEMLLNEKVINQLARENMRLAEKILDVLEKLRDKIHKAFEGVDFERTDAPFAAARAVRDSVDEIAELWAKALHAATESYNAEQTVGRETVREIAREQATQVGSYDLKDFTDAKTPDGESLFQVFAFEHDEPEYRRMLEKWGGMSTEEIDRLFTTVDAAVAKIMKNLEALDYAWEEDIDDRGFQAIKQNSDKLYKVSLDFSTLCRKRLLQGLIVGQLSASLQRGLSKEEGIAVRDALIALQEEGKQIEVACALCYVESARMRSQKAIQEFLNYREGALRNYYANQRGREAVAKAEMEERQAIYDELVKADKATGKPMSEWGLVRGKGDDATMYDIRDTKNAKMSKIPTAMKKRIQDAKKAARKGYALTAEQQATVDHANSLPVEAFTTPEGLQDLAKSKYRDIFNAFVLKVSAASKSKGIENDTWWRAGDSQAVGDALIRQMNAENGLRTQSWSDFTVKHLMDYIAATIELSTRGAKQHAYTKVLDYVDLMGRTGLMINMSLIPTRDYKGKLEYDPVEGINYDGAMKMREKFPDTAGTICIGITVDQIHQLLDSMDIDYVIPYHASGMSKDTRKLMHIPAWENFQDYQSEKKLSGSAARENARKYGVELLNESDPLWHEGPSFSEWFDLEKARATAKRVGKTGKYGVMTGGYAAMQEAAENYKRICAQRGLAPKFSYGSAAFDADFSNDAGYWKLLIDRKMVNNKTGEIIEQRALKPTFDFDTVQRILDDELKRYPGVKADQENAILRVTRSFLKGDVKAGMSSEEIAKVMQTPVDNVPITNVVQHAAQLQTYREAAETEPSQEDFNADGEREERKVQYSRFVMDPDVLEMLNKQKENGDVIVTYKTFLEIDGKLYPPMASKQRDDTGAARMAHAMEIGRWEESVGNPNSRNIISKVNSKGETRWYYRLIKDNGKTVDAAYDPYQHSSDVVLNDQFEEAYKRPNLVTYECIIPKSELTSGYHYREARNDGAVVEALLPVGKHPWKKGTVAKNLKNTNRSVYLTRWLMPVRRMENSEVAQMYKDIMDAEESPVAIPFNVVPPGLLQELEKLGVAIDYQGSPIYRSHQKGNVQMQTWEEAEKRYGIKSVNDYVGVQKAVISTLDKEGFFDGVHNVVTMDDGGMVIEITKDGIRETLGPGDRYNTLPSELKKAKIATIDQLPQVIKQAKLTEDNAKNVKNPRSGVKYAYLQGEGEYEDATREIDVTVRKSPQKNKFWIHNVQLTQKKDNELGLSTSEGNPQRAYIKAQARKDIVPESAEKSKGQEQKKLTEEQQFQKWDQDHNDWAPTFYSKMDRVVSDWTNGKGQKLPPKMAANQVVGWLRGKGVKAEEIRWSGIVPWLEGRKTVTQQELQAVMAGNEVKIETKVLGAATGRKKSNATSARWGFYNLPGGVNYREILFKIPDLAFTNGAMQMHWGVGESGIVSHTRVQDFPGFYSYTLYAEEIQSDLHNAGAANGFSESGVPDVPFAGSADTYYEYVMKQLLRLAAEHGYTTIAWPTADILSKRFGDKYREAYRIEYDQNIPKFMNKYVKQWGAKVAKTTLENNGAEVWSVELTDAMRESVLTQGQPLFQRWEDTTDDTLEEARDREVAAARLQAENAELKKTIQDLQALSKKQKGSIEKLQKMMKLTRTPETRIADAKRMARQLQADYAGRLDNDALAAELKSLGDYLLQTDTDKLSEEELKDRATAIAAEIVDTAKEQVTDSATDFMEIAGRIKGAKVSIEERYTQEIGDYEVFRKGLFGKLTVAKRENGSREGRDGYVSVDQFYNELQEDYGKGFFPEVLNEGEQLQILSRLLELSSPMEVNPFERHRAEATEEIANRIIRETMDGTLRPVEPSFADKSKSRQDALRQQILSLKREKALDEREAGRLWQTVYDLSIALDKAESRQKSLAETARYRQTQLREEGRARAAEVKARERARSEKQITALKEHYREMAERYRERRNESAGASKYRKQVEVKAAQLYEMLRTNSDKLHVPQALKAPLAEFLESLDFTSKRALKGGDETARDRVFGARLLELGQILENQQRYISGDTSVKQDFGSYLDISEDSLQFLRDSAEMITQAMREAGGFTINQMSAQQLKDLAMFLQNLRAAINNMNIFMANERYASVREAADADIAGMEQLGRAPEIAENKILNTFLWKNGTPYYIMKRFGEGGASIFRGFAKGWAQMAFDAREIIDFTEQAYTDKEVKAWKKELHEITLEDGSKIRMTTAQIMELSQLLGREQARKHILKGGIRIGNIETKKGGKGDTTHYHLTDADIQQILGELTDRQMAVAKALQRFMADKGAEWGNEVSMKRFGYQFYEEGPGYYPIRTDNLDRPMADTDIQTNSMFRLLNLSSSKSLNPRASNALIVGDIFETFSDHMGDMAKLHGMGLPVLDAIKWFNFKERIDRDDGTYDTRTLQGAMEQAFGSAAGSYFRTLMKDINGQTENGDRGGELWSRAIGRFKAAAVGANLRVALLQPTAYVRASRILKPKYMAAAFGDLRASVFNAAGASAAWKEAMQHSGEMVWKDIGGYDTDLARTMRGQIQHDDSVMDKLVEASMLGAEWGDKLTWGRLWAACKLQAKGENKSLSGKALMDAAEDLFREVIYSSQVMDSTLTRSELMRARTIGSKMVTPFMAEPTVSINILMDAASDLRNDERRLGRAEAWAKHSKKIGKAFAVYASSAAAAALAESLWDAVRDDDDEEYWKKFLAALFGDDNAARIWGDELDEKADSVVGSAYSANLWQDLSIPGKLPVLKDVISLLSGYQSTNMATDAYRNIINAYQIWRETIDLRNGVLEKPTKVTYYGKMTKWGKIYKSLQGLSQLTGLPMYGLTRDAVAIWNTVMNGRRDDWKLRTYDADQLSGSKLSSYQELVEPTGVSQKDYQRMLQEINADGNSSISQAEAGPWLLAEERAGRLSHQQAAAIWAACTTGKASYDEWIAKQK